MDADQINETVQFTLSNLVVGLLFQSTPLSLGLSIYFMAVNWLNKNQAHPRYPLQYLLLLLCGLSLLGTVGASLSCCSVPQPTITPLDRRVEHIL